MKNLLVLTLLTFSFGVINANNTDSNECDDGCKILPIDDNSELGFNDDDANSDDHAGSGD